MAGINIGATTITGAYLGSTPATAVYLGATKVWPTTVPSNISYIGSISASATTVTIPVHAVGDLLVMIAYRNATTYATVPAGWTTIYTSSAASPSIKIATKIATATNDASGTWTNANGIQAYVWRGASGTGGVLDAVQTGASGSRTYTYPAIAMTRTDGSSWISRSMRVTFTSVPASTGYTERLASTTNFAYMEDTAGGVSSAPSLDQTFAGATAGTFRCVTLELLST